MAVFGMLMRLKDLLAVSHLLVGPGPAWYTLSAHAPKYTENPGTSLYISVEQSVNSWQCCQIVNKVHNILPLAELFYEQQSICELSMNIHQVL